MSQTPIPPEHHVLRNVPNRSLFRNEDGSVQRIAHTEFQLRPGEDALSVTWIEFFAGGGCDGDWDAQLLAAARAIRRIRNVRPNSIFAWAQVDAIHAAARRRDRQIRVVHDPIPDADDRPGNPAHAGIRRLPVDDPELLDLLAAEALAQWKAAPDLS